MKRTRLLILLGLLLLATPSVSLAQQAPASGRDGGSIGTGRRSSRQPRRREIQGQVVSDGIRRLDHPIAVDLESRGVVRDTVYTDGNGNFVFDQPGRGEGFQVSINEPGFRPERIDVRSGPFSAGISVIILESLEIDEESPGDPSAVDLSELLVDIPDEAVELFEEAAEESEKGDYEKSSERLEQAIEIAPDFYRAQNALGVEYDRLGRKEDAIRHFLIAKDLSPNSAPPVVSLGAIYLRDNDTHSREGRLEEARASLDQAITHLEDAVERDPLSEFAQYYLGAAHYRTGAIDDALWRLNRALELNEEFHDVRIMLFNAYLAQRDYDAALSQLATYLELYPDSPMRAAIEKSIVQLEQQMSER